MSVLGLPGRARSGLRRRGFPERGLAVAASAAVGFAAVVQVKIGLALLVAACWTPLLLSSFGIGLATWVALPFLAGISALNLAGKGVGLMVAGIWLLGFTERDGPLRAGLRRNRTLLTAVAGLLLWVTLSVAWATDPHAAASDLWHWYAVGLIFAIVVSSVITRRLAKVIILSFVVGAVLSVLYGLAGGVSGSEAVDTATYGGRLGGATGDPNFLAAGIVPAIVLAVASLSMIRELTPKLRGVLRAAIVGTILVLCVGLVATESRGGLIAFGVALVAALVFFPGQRAWVLSVGCVGLTVIAVLLVTSPGALQRVSQAGNGSGRTSEWTVAWRVFGARPITGAGDANYVVVARNYTRQPGLLTEAQYLVQQPEVAHNTYLQFASETGAIGLILFLAVCGLSIRAAALAARRFHSLGDSVMENLARAVTVGTIAMLAAAAFISAGVDQRLWTLLGLGPALLALSRLPARAGTGAAQPVRA